MGPADPKGLPKQKPLTPMTLRKLLNQFRACLESGSEIQILEAMIATTNQIQFHALLSQIGLQFPITLIRLP